MLTHIALMERTITLLAVNGSTTLSTLEGVNVLIASVSKCPEFALALQTYNLTHPAISDSSFPDLAKLLLAASNMLPKTGTLNAVVDASPVGSLYAAQRAPRSRSGSPSPSKAPNLSSPEYAAFYKAVRALPPPTGHDSASTRPRRSASPHQRGSATPPRPPYKNPTRSDFHSHLCSAHGWNATHKSVDCKYLKSQAAPA